MHKILITLALGAMSQACGPQHCPTAAVPSVRLSFVPPVRQVTVHHSADARHKESLTCAPELAPRCDPLFIYGGSGTLAFEVNAAGYTPVTFEVSVPSDGCYPMTQYVQVLLNAIL